jgi:hypothetical protein
MMKQQVVIIFAVDVVGQNNFHRTLIIGAADAAFDYTAAAAAVKQTN